MKARPKNIPALIAITTCLVAPLGAQTNTFPSSGNVGVGTTTPSAKLDVSGGDIYLRDVAGTDGYRLRSYSNAHSFWLIPETGSLTPRLVLAPSLNWDRSLTFEYSPGVVGAVSGVLTVGQMAKNSAGWTHGYTRFLTAGTERFRIDPNGNVGIGTTSPGQRLDVNGVTRMRDSNYFGSNDEVGLISWGSMGGGTGFGMIARSGRSLSLGANNQWDHIVVNTSGNVGIGTTNPTHKLAVNGTIKAKEVIVETTGWADDVFLPDYALPSLDSVAQHIAEKGHLPGIPSAAEVAEQGVSVGDMQVALLRKVEELTLHLIVQQQEIAALKQKLSAAGIGGE